MATTTKNKILFFSHRGAARLGGDAGFSRAEVANGRDLRLFGRCEGLALKAAESMSCSEEAKFAAVPHHDAGGAHSGFDDVGIVHNGPCRRLRPAFAEVERTRR